MPAFYRMKLNFLLFLFFILSAGAFAQKNIYSFDLFNAGLEKSVLTVKDKKNAVVYSRRFNDPAAASADLDNDGINELLITDAENKGGMTYYTLYIFNTIDSFYVADSIDSGLTQPYDIYSKELKSMMIVTGNPKFNLFNTDTSFVCLPANCWSYESGKVSAVNGRLYDFFIAENDTLIDNIDSYLENNPKDCNTSNELRAFIASVYANYLQAGEKILARQFLHKYYFCKDAESFKDKIISLL